MTSSINIKKLASNLEHITFQNPGSQSPGRRNSSPRSLERSTSKKAEKVIEQTGRMISDNKEMLEQLAKKRQVRAISIKLNDKSLERQKELAERLKEIQLIIKPAKDSTTIRISTSLLEMWRTAGSTSIMDQEEMIQFIRFDSDDKYAKVDHVDMAKRFKRLFEIYKKYTGDDTPTPDTTLWTSEICDTWAKNLEKEGRLNMKMRSLVNSSNQSMFTGSLSHLDVLKYYPQYTDEPLFATILAGSQKINRIFHANKGPEIKLILPYTLKYQQTKEEYATIVAEYIISFDQDMNAISLTSKALEPQYHNKERGKTTG